MYRHVAGGNGVLQWYQIRSILDVRLGSGVFAAMLLVAAGFVRTSGGEVVI
jgi:hypothetical protein